ncbi:MAG: hypothetical protein ACP5J4_00850 [Anaerolineae bacterium]
MAKLRRRKKQTRKPAHRKRKSQDQWLRWGIGAAVIFVVGAMIWTAVARGSGPPASAVRSYEEFIGVTGTSFAAGMTVLRYPNPGKKGGGV